MPKRNDHPTEASENDPFVRGVAIGMLLQRGGVVSAKVLRERFGISRAQSSRDLLRIELAIPGLRVEQEHFSAPRLLRLPQQMKCPEMNTSSTVFSSVTFDCRTTNIEQIRGHSFQRVVLTNFNFRNEDHVNLARSAQWAVLTSRGAVVTTTASQLVL